MTEEQKALIEKYKVNITKDKPLYDKYFKEAYNSIEEYAVDQKLRYSKIPFWEDEFKDSKLGELSSDLFWARASLMEYLVDLDEA